MQSFALRLLPGLIVLAVANPYITASPLSTIAPSQDNSSVKPIDPAALSRAQTKLQHALRVAKRFETIAQNDGYGDDGWRYKLIANLMKIDEANFATVESATSIADAIGKSHAQIGQRHATDVIAKSVSSATSDLVYLPITPCRILDTRAAAGASISGGQTATYNLDAVNTGHSSCGVDSQIPGDLFSPAAAAVNVTIDERGLPSFPDGSYIEIFPQGGSGVTSFMNFSPNQVEANAGVISLNQSNDEFSIYASAPANVIVDVFGIFIPPQATGLTCMRVHDNFSAAANADTSSGSSTAAVCPASFTLTGSGCSLEGTTGATLIAQTSLYSSTPTATFNSGGAAFCEVRNTNATAVNVGIDALCCQIPGR